MLASDVGPGKEVGLVRAQGLPQETVLYGLGEVGDEWEGAFEIGVSSGQITVGTRGPDLLVIVRVTNHNDYTLFLCMHRRRTVHRCRLRSQCLHITNLQAYMEIG